MQKLFIERERELQIYSKRIGIKKKKSKVKEDKGIEEKWFKLDSSGEMKS